MKENLNKIICGDNVKVLSGFPDGCIDLTVTSPPYDKLRDYKGYTFDFEGIANELYRVTKQGGVVVWVVGDATVNGSETGTSFRQALYFKDIGFNLHDTMIYNKNGFMAPSSNRYHQVFEYMFIFSKDIPAVFNGLKDRRNINTVRGGLNKRRKDGTMSDESFKKIELDEFGLRFNIWNIEVGYMKSSKDEIAFEHPAIFPEKLARDHILSWSNENDVILDPLSGSGTTCKMAYRYKRNYIGIDVSEEYCRIADKRLLEEKAQLTLDL